MPLHVRTTSSGRVIIGTELVTVDDGVATLGLAPEDLDWEHLLIGASASGSPFALLCNEKLNRLHLLVRSRRDLRLGTRFTIAIVRGPRRGLRVVDVIALAQSIVVDLQAQALDTLDDALAWVDTTVPDG